MSSSWLTRFVSAHSCVRTFDQVFNPDYTITNGVYLGSFPVLKFSGTFTWVEETARLEFTFNEVGGLVIGFARNTVLWKLICCISHSVGGKRVAIVFAHYMCSQEEGVHVARRCARMMYSYAHCCLCRRRAFPSTQPRKCPTKWSSCGWR